MEIPGSRVSECSKAALQTWKDPVHNGAFCRLVGTNLIIPHIVGNAGVLRNFSAYLAQLLNVNGQTDLQVNSTWSTLLYSISPSLPVHPVVCHLWSQICSNVVLRQYCSNTYKRWTKWTLKQEGETTLGTNPCVTY